MCEILSLNFHFDGVQFVVKNAGISAKRALHEKINFIVERSKMAQMKGILVLIIYYNNICSKIHFKSCFWVIKYQENDFRDSCGNS